MGFLNLASSTAVLLGLQHRKTSINCQMMSSATTGGRECAAPPSATSSLAVHSKTVEAATYQTMSSVTTGGQGWAAPLSMTPGQQHRTSSTTCRMMSLDMTGERRHAAPPAVIPNRQHKATCTTCRMMSSGTTGGQGPSQSEQLKQDGAFTKRMQPCRTGSLKRLCNCLPM